MAAELILIRHGQASFGAADYDRLSPTGHAQARALGRAIGALGIAPDAVFLGTMRRHRETWAGINAALGFDGVPQVLAGFDEFDFAGLLEAAYRGRVQPADLHSDRRTHFSALRDTVLEWQRGQIADPPETYDGFAARVAQARSRAMAGARRGACVLAITSGGPIGQSIAQIVQAPADAMIRLQLQVRNCSLTRIIVTPRAEHVSTFNETPHIDGQNADQMLTYS